MHKFCACFYKKLFWQQLLGPKISLDPTFFYPKFFLIQFFWCNIFWTCHFLTNIFGPNIFLDHNFLPLILVEPNFFIQHISPSSKKMLSQKNVVQKSFLKKNCKKNLVFVSKKCCQNWVSNCWDIPYMVKCHVDKCCLDKCHPDSWYLLNVVPETYPQSLVKIGSVTAVIFLIWTNDARTNVRLSWGWVGVLTIWNVDRS